MAGPKTYVGVSSKARQVSGIYVGVSGKARKVTKVYVGVSGKARLVFSADFWTAGGVAAANCLAAYQCKGAASATAALTDLTGHGYTLTKHGGATWASATGYTMDNWGSLQNASLDGKEIKSIVVRFGNLPTTEKTTYPLALPGGASNNIFLYARIYDRGFFNGASRDNVNTNFPARVYAYTYYETAGTTPRYKFKCYIGEKKLGATGVLGFSGGTLYSNGTAQTTTNHITDTESTQQPISGSNRYTLGYGHGISILAAAYYSVALTAAQHKAVADAMLAL